MSSFHLSWLEVPAELEGSQSQHFREKGTRAESHAAGTIGFYPTRSAWRPRGPKLLSGMADFTSPPGNTHCCSPMANEQ